MTSSRDPRRSSRIGVVVVLGMVVLVGAVWWWKYGSHAAPPAAPAVVQPRQGAGATPASPRARELEPAQVTVTVTDDRGPVADATVRLAPGESEPILVRTGRDGVARADHLEPGAWTISASAADHLPAALPSRALAAGARETLTLALRAGGRLLTGTVSDVSGGPIAGARIDAARLDADAQPGDAVATALTGSDGRYRLTVAPGPLLVGAANTDYAPQARVVEVTAAGAVADFALVPGGVIEGIVRDERSGDPVPGAEVVARHDRPAIVLAEGGAQRTLTRADGRFRLAGLRPGAWELDASDHARRSRAATVVGLGVAEQLSDVELLLGASPVVRGTVVDDTGAPATGVTVRAFSRGFMDERPVDAKGGFVLEGIRPGEYRLSAAGPSYLPAAAVRVEVADRDVDRVVVTVQRARRVKGHVEPRQICKVEQDLDQRQGGVRILTEPVTTGHDGEFDLGPTGDGATRLVARCDGGDQGQVNVTVAAGMPDVVLAVGPGGVIAGRVVDGEGKPVAGAGVIATRASGTERTTITNGMVTSGVQGTTDANGAYQLIGIPAGSYRLGALDRGRPLHLRSRPPEVELSAGQRKTGVDLVIDRPDGVITGTVLGPDGAPLADAWVSVQLDLIATLHAARQDGARRGPVTQMMVVETSQLPGGPPDTGFPPALTDAQGHYAIRNLPRATYTVIAEAGRGQLRARATSIKPDATVDLRLLGVTSLSGTVTGPGGPAAVFSVELDGPTRAQRSFTGGRFSFGRVDPGTYVVRAQSTAGSAEGTVEIKPGEPATLDLTLAANTVVVGRLVDPAGKPLAGLPVVLTPDRGDGALRVQLSGPPATTGPDGSFRIEHRAEPCALMVLRPLRPFSRRGLALEAGKTLELGPVTVEPPAAGSGAPTP